MCDIYFHDCVHPGCGGSVDMHIGDFKFDREEFRVWCGEHVLEAEAGAVVFSGKCDGESVLCAIAGPEVGDMNDGDNHPNWDDWEEQTVEEYRAWVTSRA